MKGVRILQVVLLILLALYLVLFNNVNPDPLALPLVPVIFPAPPVLVLIVALVGGWLVGWLPVRLRLWREHREARRLQQRLTELERGEALRDSDLQSRPGIPDRMPIIPDRIPMRDDVDDDAQG